MMVLSQPRGRWGRGSALSLTLWKTGLEPLVFRTLLLFAKVLFLCSKTVLVVIIVYVASLLDSLVIKEQEEQRDKNRR